MTFLSWRMGKVVVGVVLCALVWWLLGRPSTGLPPRVGGLRVAVANLLGANEVPDDASRFLAQLDADVVVLTEWTGANLYGPPLKQAGWQVLLNAPNPGMGICVLAREAQLAEAAIVTLPPMGQWEIPVAVLRVTVGDQAMAVLGIHVPPPVPPYDLFREPTIQAVMSWVRHGRLVDTVGPGIPGDPVLIVGDFNAFSWSDVMSPVEESGLKDAWEETHWKPGPTWGPWHGFPSVARIDYVFASPDLPMLGCWTLELPGSDHRMMVAEVGVPMPAGLSDRH